MIPHVPAKISSLHFAHNLSLGSLDFDAKLKLLYVEEYFRKIAKGLKVLQK